MASEHKVTAVFYSRHAIALKKIKESTGQTPTYILKKLMDQAWGEDLSNLPLGSAKSSPVLTSSDNDDDEVDFDALVNQSI